MFGPHAFRIHRFLIAAALLLLAQPAFAEKRVALIIGNSAYQNVPQLTNPVNDGAVMTATLPDGLSWQARRTLSGWPIRASVRLSISAGGHLHKLRRIEEEGLHVTILIAETFTDFGHSFGIAPPPAEAIVEAPAKVVTTQNEFGELLGPPPFGND